MSGERRIFKSIIYQVEKRVPDVPISRNEGRFQIMIQTYRQNRFWYGDDIDDWMCDHYVKVNGRGLVLYPHEFDGVLMSWTLLKRMGVPQSEHPTIFENLIQFAEIAVPNMPIYMHILDINVCSTGSLDNQSILDYVNTSPVRISDGSFRPGAPINIVARESIILDSDLLAPSNWVPVVAEDSRMVVYRDNFIPNSTLSIWGLMEVSHHDLEDVIRNNPSCAICLISFETCGDSEPITGLPCAHHFHVHCIVRWLEVNHTCPLCRYLMPTADVNVPT